MEIRREAGADISVKIIFQTLQTTVCTYYQNVILKLTAIRECKGESVGGKTLKITWKNGIQQPHYPRSSPSRFPSQSTQTRTHTEQAFHHLKHHKAVHLASRRRKTAAFHFHALRSCKRLQPVPDSLFRGSRQALPSAGKRQFCICSRHSPGRRTEQDCK